MNVNEQERKTLFTILVCTKLKVQEWYLYQILTTFNKLKITSEVVHDTYIVVFHVTFTIVQKICLLCMFIKPHFIDGYFVLFFVYLKKELPSD